MAATADSGSQQLLTELVAELAGLDAEPWQLRPTTTGTVKVIVGANPARVQGHLDGAGYAIEPLDIPLRDGWESAWVVKS